MDPKALAAMYALGQPQAQAPQQELPPGVMDEQALAQMAGGMSSINKIGNLSALLFAANGQDDAARVVQAQVQQRLADLQRRQQESTSYGIHNIDYEREKAMEMLKLRMASEAREEALAEERSYHQGSLGIQQGTLDMNTANLATDNARQERQLGLEDRRVGIADRQASTADQREQNMNRHYIAQEEQAATNRDEQTALAKAESRRKLAHDIMQDVAFSAPGEAEAIIKSDPMLLEPQARAIDPSLDGETYRQLVIAGIKRRAAAQAQPAWMQLMNQGGGVGFKSDTPVTP